MDDYYIDFTAKTEYKGPRDDQGIPLLNYTGSIGVQYNPCAVSQLALGYFQLWRRNNDERARDSFFRLADWLCETLHQEGERAYWLYFFDLDAYGVKAPWKSALAQAQAISVLVRADRYSKNEGQYRNAADRAFSGLICPIEEGGLLLQDGQDLWLEEVVANRKTAILDGAIFALLGVKDYFYATGNISAENSFRKGVETIARKLPTYDMGYWSRADLYQEHPPMPASWFYHDLHVYQLTILFQLTGDDLFQHYASRWNDNRNSRISRYRALADKIFFKLKYY